MPSSGVQTCARSEEHTSELQSQSHLVCRLLLEKKTVKNSQPPPSLITTKLMTIMKMGLVNIVNNSQPPPSRITTKIMPIMNMGIFFFKLQGIPYLLHFSPHRVFPN